MIAVLIADIVRSTRMKDRARVQQKLNNILDKTNFQHRGSIFAKLLLTRGDEFEGAFKDAWSCYCAFEDIEQAFYPIRIRAGIGIGEISTEFSKRVTSMDGPAFHRAREGLRLVKKGTSGVLIHSGNKEMDESVNIVLRLLWSMRDKWTDRQRMVIDHYLSLDAPTHAKVAEHFGVRQPTISDILSKGHARAMYDARLFLMHRLSSKIQARK